MATFVPPGPLATERSLTHEDASIPRPGLVERGLSR